MTINSPASKAMEPGDSTKVKQLMCLELTYLAMTFKIFDRKEKLLMFAKKQEHEIINICEFRYFRGLKLIN